MDLAPAVPPLPAALLLLLGMGGVLGGARGGSPPLCDYERCRHLQPPCSRLRPPGCLCPGLSGPGVPPEPPELLAVTVTATGASVRWCAPASVVRDYRLTVTTTTAGTTTSGAAGPAGSVATFPATFRAAAVGGLRPDTPYVLCVVARNGAGDSPRAAPGGGPGGPCRAVRTPPDPRGLLPAAAAAAAAMGGAGGAALLWHCLRRRGGSRGDPPTAGGTPPVGTGGGTPVTPS